MRPSLLAAALVVTPILAQAPKGMPEWVFQEDSEKVVSGVGTAAIMGNDRHQQRMAAVNDGRLKLGAKVAARVQARVEGLQKKAGEAAAALDPAVLERVTTETAKALASARVGKVTPTQMWNNPDDRSLFVYLSLEAPALDKWLDEALEAQLKTELGCGRPVQPLLDALKAK